MSRANRLLVGQSGGPTAVINASLAGILRECTRHGEIGGTLGMQRGVDGLLARQFIDLGGQSEALLRRLASTPSSALGSCRRKLDDSELPAAVNILVELGVRYVLYIGGNDSADTSHRLAAAAASAGYPLTVVGVPKTIDNDLVAMDHTPGYPSIARYVAMATQDAGMDAEATASVDQVRILEVMGRNSGWVAAAAAVAKRLPHQAPHLIYVPERPFSGDSFLADVEEAYKRFGFAVVVVTETVRDQAGRFWAQAPDADAFGHPRLVGAADRLCQLVRQNLGLRARFDKPGTLQRSSSLCASPIDRAEAEAAGEAAVQAAIAGHTDQMVTIQRMSDQPYRSFTALAPLAAIANAERQMPDEYLNAAGNFVTPAFLKYVRPLIGVRLPVYARLRDGESL
jgi:ATP-dependent phosphofructokinase / diphosphate-dependent phosphofructokinase